MAADRVFIRWKLFPTTKTTLLNHMSDVLMSRAYTAEEQKGKVVMVPVNQADLCDESTMFKINFVLGNADCNGDPLPESVIETGCQYVEQAFAGGSSTITQRGRYHALDGSFTTERSSLIWGYSGVTPSTEYLQHVAAVAARILRQREVLLSIEKLAGVWYFVSPASVQRPIDLAAS